MAPSDLGHGRMPHIECQPHKNQRTPFAWLPLASLPLASLPSTLLLSTLLLACVPQKGVETPHLVSASPDSSARASHETDASLMARLQAMLGPEEATTPVPAAKPPQKSGRTEQTEAGQGGSTGSIRTKSSRESTAGARPRTPRAQLMKLPPVKSASGIEDPSGRALYPFFDALARVQAQELNSKAVAIQFGDSHTAADFLTSQIRRSLQSRFGDAGRGFLFPGRAFKYYYQRDVKHGGEGPWQNQNGLLTSAIEPLGLGGIRATASSPDARLYLETCDTCQLNNRVSSFELYYWRKPGNGWLQLAVDGAPLRVLDTGVPASDTDALEGSSGWGSTGYFRVDLPDAPHRLEAWPTGDGPVDLFGIVMERDVPGVTWDALGLNGAWVGTSARWTWALASEQLSHRDPSLIVTWYGTNESGMHDFTMESYEETWRKLLGTLKAAAPESACLMIGPPDRLMRGGGNVSEARCKPRKDRRGRKLPIPSECRYRPAQLLTPIIQVQRHIAQDFGCAFWDARAAMGGPGSMGDWVELGLAQGDRVHLTREGYEKLGSAIATDLTLEFDRYMAMLDEQP